EEKPTAASVKISDSSSLRVPITGSSINPVRGSDLTRTALVRKSLPVGELHANLLDGLCMSFTKAVLELVVPLVHARFPEGCDLGKSMQWRNLALTRR